jgi:hypothetical protein
MSKTARAKAEKYKHTLVEFYLQNKGKHPELRLSLEAMGLHGHTLKEAFMRLVKDPSQWSSAKIRTGAVLDPESTN